MQNVDFYYSKSKYLSQNTFIQAKNQGLTTKKSKLKKSQPKNLKLANRKISNLFYINKPKKTFHQDKKKKYLNKKQNQKNFTLTIRNNAIKDEKKRKN